MLTKIFAAVSVLLNRILGWMLESFHALAAVGFIRSIYGLTSLALLVSSWPDRHLFFGPTGLLATDELGAQWTSADAWSVFDLAPTTATFDAIYIAFAVIALLTMLGIGGKGILVLQYVGTWSIFSQNSLLGDGGDNIMYICGIFLLLTRCFDRFSVRKKRHQIIRIPIPAWASKLVHNTGVMLIAVQICIVYFIAGSFKMQGEMWTSGTALYYVLRNPEYYLPGIELFFYFAWPSVIASYITVLSQVLFPILIIFRQTRLPIVIIMMVFHLGIAVVMGLTSFGLIMIACDTIFVSGHLCKLIEWMTGKKTNRKTIARPELAQDPERELFPVHLGNAVLATDINSPSPGDADTRERSWCRGAERNLEPHE